MKKICFITTISMTLKAFVIDTAKYLQEQGGYEVTIICDTDEEFSASLPMEFKYISVPMKRGISLSGLKAILTMYIIFKKNKFDIVQYSTPNASFYASIASKMAQIPVRLYCQWGIVYVSFSGFKRKIFKLLEKIICFLSTRIEPDSFGNLKFCYEEGLYTKDKSAVIWNGSASGVNLKKFDVNNKNEWRSEIRENYSISDNTFLFGFVGRITRDKGINELFEACRNFFNEYPNSALMLIGDNENNGSISNELYSWSKSEKRVIYCGRTTEVEKYLSALDAFILPSYREGFGSVVIEAEAMGVPVIVTDIPGPTDAMLPNKTGLIVEKGNHKSLFNAMKIMISNSTMMKEMSVNAIDYAKNNFDRDILFKEILKDREQLLSNMEM